MTASTNPDDNSYTRKDPAEPSGFVYDDPNAPPQTESTYVPEREFVLMPLFRRIGELLGIRRESEPEHVYEAASGAPHTESGLAHEELSFVPEETSASRRESSLAGISTAEPAREPADQWSKPETVDPLPGVIPPAAQPVFLESAGSQPKAPTFEPLPEIEASSSHHEPLAPEIVSPPSALAEPETEPAAHEWQDEAEVIEAPGAYFEESPQDHPATESHVPETELPAATVFHAMPAPAAKPQPRPPARRPDELDEAIAMLREAGSKISAAISEAVEWLSTKENELVRKAERSLAPAPKARRVQTARSIPGSRPVESTTASREAIAADDSETASTSSSVPKWEPLAFPGLQREAAWQERRSAAAEKTVSEVPPVSSSMDGESVKRRPVLVRSRRRVPFWKRIDWAGEFTPKRVAVLGGVMMAMLLVLGVSLARRPASEVLPPQPRPIQPGGVTVTTHPRASATTPPKTQPRRTAAPAPRAVAPAAHRSQRALSYDNEPDVVTHYYKAKPSPSKQATVAGVKHYSDME
ncbi:MAG: hypothetical protein DMG61_03000 [Acidobacteria bacterium]|nr:MAG: hypothetical protein DMG61_03000 [Acidobacteriota bacterium]